VILLLCLIEHLQIFKLPHQYRIMYTYFFLYLLVLATSGYLQAQENCVLEVANPSCERLLKPIGIDMEQPRLSWYLNSACSNQRQSAYQIIVASTVEKLKGNEGDVWDSKKVTSSNSLNVQFSGLPLKTAETYYWKVKVWNAEDIASNWSRVEQWTMGLMSKESNKANWIGLNIALDSASKEQKEAAHYLFTTFKTENKKRVKQATVFVSGLGLFDLYINGKLISDHRLNPSNTNFFKRANYVGFDVTDHIRDEANAIGVVLGNGKHDLHRKRVRQYGLPRLWCQIYVQYNDGSSEVVKSNRNWKITTQGPVRFNNEFDGERYDARMEIADWATVKMDASAWKQVDELEDYNPILSPQLMSPVRVVETLTAKKITKSASGGFIFDFGQNVTGWGSLNIKGERGKEVSLRFTELLDSLGNLDTTSIREARATDVFILKGEGVESFEPRFIYHGFRYVEIKGLSRVPDTSLLKACVAHNDLEAVGSFVCSNPLLNQIYSNAKWSVRGNYQHVPVDCPQRDERYGWLGDRSATAFGELYLYDIQHFYAKWMQDIADEQLASGSLPNLAPAHWEVYRDNVTWPATYVQLVGLLYRYYGDSLAVVKHYDGMKKWMDYMAKNYTLNQVIYSDQYGDWLVPPQEVTQESNKDPRLKSSADILATATYLMALKDMYTFAKLLQKEEDTPYYKKRIDTLKKVLYERLMNKSRHSYGNHSPTELLLLLAGDDLSNRNRSLLLENLLGMLRGQYDGKMTFGLVGMRWPMKVLSESGAVDFTYELATSRRYPSWGYMVDQGATTMWEVWTGKAKKSQNHVMLIGDLLQWFYVYLGGIKQADDAIAFDKLKLVPNLPEDLDSVNVSFLSPRGKIVSKWTKDKCKFNWHVELPIGTVAELYLPSNKPSSFKKHKHFLRLDTLAKNKLYAVFKLGSGAYDFESVLQKNNQREKYSSPPEISLQDSVIAKKNGETYMVQLSAKEAKTKIYYTLDGSDPNLKSKQYKMPFELNAYTMIKTIAKEKGKAPSYVKNSFVDIYNPEKNGWNYRYYEDKLQLLPNYDTLVAVDSGRVSVINLKKLKQRLHFWAFQFEAYLDIPIEGEYSFYLSSDDGARIIIDDKEVVINDGIHYRTQRNGRTQLTKGKHNIRIDHFNWWSYNSLELLMSGPGLPRQKVPVSWLYFKD